MAQRANTFLLVESKDHYAPADAGKLARVLSDRAYRHSLRERFGLDWATSPRLVAAIALPDGARLPRGPLEGLAIILVGPAGVRAAQGPTAFG